jgi:ubiquinone/menaquinone biosynthesis C-methylase UbiE
MIVVTYNLRGVSGMRTHARLLHGNRPRAFQGRNSRIYNFVATRLLRGVYRRFARDIADVAPKDATVLDVGAGPGVLLAELARLRPDLSLTGIDLSPDMVTAASRNLGPYAERATVSVGDVADLPLADRSFDLITSSFSSHHWDEPEAAVLELARVLRPGGQVAIYDFRFAPFDRLTAAARAGSLFTGRPPQRTPIRTGVPLLPRCVRLVFSA